MQVSSLSQSSKADGLLPDSVAYRPSPIRFRGMTNFSDGINALCGRPEKINNDFIFSMLNGIAGEFSTVGEKMDLNCFNEVNKLLSVISSKKVQLIDAKTKESVETIRTVCKRIFEEKNFLDASPLDFADANANDKEISLWELFLQIRGRCLQLELLYEVKHGTVSQLQALESQIRDFVEENSRLSILLMSEKGVSETLRSLHTEEIEEIKRDFRDELEEKDLKLSQMEGDLGRARRQTSGLVQENVELKRKNEDQELRIAELENKLARLQGREEREKEVMVQGPEVIQKVENKEWIRALERGNKELKQELEFYKQESSDASALRDRVKEQKREIQREHKENKKLQEDVQFFQQERSEVLAISDRVEKKNQELKQMQLEKFEELADTKEKLRKVVEAVHSANKAYMASSSDMVQSSMVLYRLLEELIHVLGKK